MKALSVKQPWATFLVYGEKTIEVRSWRTKYRGELLICASAAESNVWIQNDDEQPLLLPAGATLGVVRLIECRPATAADADAALCEIPQGAYAWVIDASQAYDTRPDKVIGRLRLFEVADKHIHRLDDEDHWWNYPPPQGKRKLSERSITLW